MKQFMLSLMGGAVIAATTITSSASAQLLNLPSSNKVVPDNQLQVQLSYAPVVKGTAPAVVNVFSSRTVRTRQRISFFDMMRDMGRAPTESVQNSLGSGVIVRDSGIIVTNAHVVKGADELRVVLNDRREFDAKVIAQDEEIDLAVLEIDTKGERLPTLSIDKSDDLEIGDIVLAIGNPFGVGQTVTSGIVSALGRTNVTNSSSFIQTDAAVNPGNSGGALVDLNGNLIGVNTAIFSRSGGSNGIGFAIPGVLVARAVDSAVTEGKIVRPWLGARTSAVDSALAATLGLDRARGAIISDVHPGGPADRAGLKARDVVLAVDGTEINDESGLRFKLATLELGSRADVDIMRGGQNRTLRTKIETPQEIPARDERLIDGYNPLDGATIVNMSPALGDEIGVDPYVSGVMILSLKRRSAASSNGLRPADLIVEINGEEIDSARQLETLLISEENAEDWSVSIDRNGKIYDVPIRYLPREN